uniref:Gonadoliberin-1 n=1 Tax=Clupea pallasii TaxID=30724 RepID=GON1_CLUPA|nr:RecName: Full=Gonadoliberin-1; AltName: Full=Gonadoliberin I; AltName: Full=Gonadotropin-releasing hormone I; Short=GnRH-I; AltName: Full=LH-RH; AltName: Full=Luliberin I [Clupea pallasii]
QHWSHGLSPG